MGTYTVDQLPNDPPRYFSFILKPNGSMITESQPTGAVYYLATGTWSLSGTTLTCKFVYLSTVQGYSVTQNVTATYDPATAKLTGTWRDETAPGGSGKFNRTEVQ